MTFSIRLRDVNLSDELRDQIERRASFALDRYGAHIKDLSIYLADLNGPKGGVDKLCQITAVLTRDNPVRILETGDSMLPAISRALRRLSYRIGRRVQRRRPAAQKDRATIRAAA